MILKAMKRIPLLWLMVSVLLLGACTPVSPEPQIPPTGEDVDTYGELVGTLEATGATVIPMGMVEHPLSNLTGQLVRVNGVDIQVFEFDEVVDREQVSVLIQQNAGMVTQYFPQEVGEPHFWAQSRLLVAYFGEDRATINTMSNILGEPLEITEVESGQPGIIAPNVVIETVTRLGSELGVPLDQVQIVNFEEVEWPDSCLGLGEANESCARVTTPGYRVILEVEGQEYEYRTDQTGLNIRQAP